MKRISEATRYTVCYNLDDTTEQRFECTAKYRSDALAQLQKKLGRSPTSVLRIVPIWLSSRK